MMMVSSARTLTQTSLCTHQGFVYVHASINGNLPAKVIVVLLLTTAPCSVIGQQLGKTLQRPVKLSIAAGL